VHSHSLMAPSRCRHELEFRCCISRMTARARCNALHSRLRDGASCAHTCMCLIGPTATRQAAAQHVCAKDSHCALHQRGQDDATIQVCKDTLSTSITFSVLLDPHRGSNGVYGMECMGAVELVIAIQSQLSSVHLSLLSINQLDINSQTHTHIFLQQRPAGVKINHNTAQTYRIRTPPSAASPRLRIRSFSLPALLLAA